MESCGLKIERNSPIPCHFKTRELRIYAGIYNAVQRHEEKANQNKVEQLYRTTLRVRFLADRVTCQ